MGTPVPGPEKGRRRLSPPRAGFAGAAKITRLEGEGQPGGRRNWAAPSLAKLQPHIVSMGGLYPEAPVTATGAGGHVRDGVALQHLASCANVPDQQGHANDRTVRGLAHTRRDKHLISRAGKDDAFRARIERGAADFLSQVATECGQQVGHGNRDVIQAFDQWMR